MPPKKKVYGLANRLPSGAKVVDRKVEYTLKNVLGVGGFGTVYLAQVDCYESASYTVCLLQRAGDRTPYAIKVEPHGNGPLFSESHIYSRLLKEQSLEEFRKMRSALVYLVQDSDSLSLLQKFQHWHCPHTLAQAHLRMVRSSCAI